jgi:hypothetical protein
MEAFFDILIDHTWNSMWKKKIKREKKEEKKGLLESFFPPCSTMEERSSRDDFHSIKDDRHWSLEHAATTRWHSSRVGVCVTLARHTRHIFFSSFIQFNPWFSSVFIPYPNSLITLSFSLLVQIGPWFSNNFLIWSRILSRLVMIKTELEINDYTRKEINKMA